jgi:hypothetical protein
MGYARKSPTLQITGREASHESGQITKKVEKRKSSNTALSRPAQRICLFVKHYNNDYKNQPESH